jgi:protease I
MAVKPEVERAGAAWVEPAADASNAVTDKNLVTAVAWPGHPAWIKQFLDLLGTKIEP